MVTTSDALLWKAAWSYKDHGKSWDGVYQKEHPPGFRWLHESFGSNWRMLEMQAAVGRIQLRRMAEWTAARQANMERIRRAAGSIPGVRVPEIPEWAVHAAYKCYLFLEPERLREGWSRERVMEEINARGVPCYSGSCSEIYREKAFEGSGFRPDGRLAVAKMLGETSLMFLVHPTLDARHIEQSCAVLRDVMRAAAG